MQSSSYSNFTKPTITAYTGKVEVGGAMTIKIPACGLFQVGIENLSPCQKGNFVLETVDSEGYAAHLLGPASLSSSHQFHSLYTFQSSSELRITNTSNTGVTFKYAIASIGNSLK